MDNVNLTKLFTFNKKPCCNTCVHVLNYVLGNITSFKRQLTQNYSMLDHSFRSLRRNIERTRRSA
ncbi:Hypothetical predicted protein, partial [Paramuricea clavata]